MTVLKVLLFAVTAGFLSMLVSCETTGTGASSSSGAAAGTDTGAEGFLVTNYASLSKWLDERFEVDYKHMTPQLIFDQVPLNDIFYQTSNLPTSAPPFNYSSKDISRRELLKRIATHWKLDMSFVMDANGNPSAVKVVGR